MSSYFIFGQLKIKKLFLRSTLIKLVENKNKNQFLLLFLQNFHDQYNYSVACSHSVYIHEVSNTITTTYSVRFHNKDLV